MSHNTHEGIRNLFPVSSISLALFFFYFITRYQTIAQTEKGIKPEKVYFS